MCLIFYFFCLRFLNFNIGLWVVVVLFNWLIIVVCGVFSILLGLFLVFLVILINVLIK